MIWLNFCDANRFFVCDVNAALLVNNSRCLTFVLLRPAVIRALNLQSLMGNRLPYCFLLLPCERHLCQRIFLFATFAMMILKDFTVSCFMLHFRLFIVNSNVYLRLSLMGIMHPFNCSRENCGCLFMCSDQLIKQVQLVIRLTPGVASCSWATNNWSIKASKEVNKIAFVVFVYIWKRCKNKLKPERSSCCAALVKGTILFDKGDTSHLKYFLSGFLSRCKC